MKALFGLTIKYDTFFVVLPCNAGNKLRPAMSAIVLKCARNGTCTRAMPTLFRCRIKLTESMLKCLPQRIAVAEKVP